jgi:penicillin-binding protein 1A
LQTLKNWLSYAAAVLAGIVLVGSLVVLLFIAITYPRLPSLDSLTDYQPKVPMRIYSADKQLLGEFGEERRSVVKLSQVPKSLQDAVLAAEDANFYEHGGVDWMGVLRALYMNLTSNNRQGGSTITQQVAKNFFLSSERSLSRKANEALLAYKIERNLSKEQILELYLNQIYLGQRAYGFASAAQIYYGKDLSKLTIAESAMLAGLPKAPSTFNPIVNPSRARLRQQYVLRRMNELDFISDDEHKKASAEVLTYSRDGRSSQVHAEYANELVRQQVFELFGEAAYTRGLKVETTLLAGDQEAAYQALRRGVLDYDRRHGYRGPEAYVTLPTKAAERQEAVETALEQAADSDDLLAAVVLTVKPNKIEVSRGEDSVITIEGDGLRLVRNAISDKAGSERIRPGAVIRIYSEGKSYRVVQLPQVEAALIALSPEDGAVRSLAGGFDFSRNQFNHVTQAARQPGSSIKPFIYSAALEKGITPASIFLDGEVKISGVKTGSGDDWEPKNYDGKFDGLMPIRVALAKSKNSVMVRVMEKIGVQYAQDYIQKFGFDPKTNPAVYALALGSGSATPMQMATAYATLANGGYRVKPYFISRVLDSKGEVLFQASPVKAGVNAEQVIDPRNSFLMTNMLQDVIKRGTATAALKLKRPDIAGKTGTTNDAQDAWFAGYSPKLVAVTWLGFDTPRSLGEHETGGGASLPIWINYMSKALQNVPVVEIKPPEGLIAKQFSADGAPEYFYAEYPLRMIPDPFTGQDPGTMSTTPESEPADPIKALLKNE